MSSGGSRWGRVVSPSRRTSVNAHRISDCGASCQRADNRFDLPAARRALLRRSGWVDGGSQLPCCQRDATLRAGHPETHAVGEPGCSISTDSAGRVSQLWCSCSCALRGSSAAVRCIDAGQCRRRTTGSSNASGNHVLLRCAGTDVDVLIAHLKEGTVRVAKGDNISEGWLLGAIGNSGNSTEPHLHIHARRGGSTDSSRTGVGVPIRFNGRFLVRNATVTR